jgi:hypothetical protein
MENEAVEFVLFLFLLYMPLNITYVTTACPVLEACLWLPLAFLLFGGPILNCQVVGEMILQLLIRDEEKKFHSGGEPWNASHPDMVRFMYVRASSSRSTHLDSAV